MDIAAEQSRGRSFTKVDAGICRATDFNVVYRQSAVGDTDADAEGSRRVTHDSEARQFGVRQSSRHDGGPGIRVGDVDWQPYGRFARCSTHQAYSVLQNHSFTIFA